MKPWEKYGKADPRAAVYEWGAFDLLCLPHPGLTMGQKAEIKRVSDGTLALVEAAYEAGYAAGQHDVQLAYAGGDPSEEQPCPDCSTDPMVRAAQTAPCRTCNDRRYV